MSLKFLSKVLTRVKKVDKDLEDWLTYHSKRNVEIEAWRFVKQEALKEKLKQKKKE